MRKESITQVSPFNADPSSLLILKENIKNFALQFLNENEERLCINLKIVRFLKFLALKLLRIFVDKESEETLKELVKKFDKILMKSGRESFLTDLMFN